MVSYIVTPYKGNRYDYVRTYALAGSFRDGSVWGFGALPFLLLFVRVYLLREMHLVLHLLPVLSMVGTLWAVSRLEAVESLLDVLRLQGL